MKIEEYERNFVLEEHYWWFIGMRKIYIDLMQHILNAKVSSRYILDIGCGTGIITKHLERLGKVVGVDKEILAVQFCKKRKIQNLIVAHGNKLPFKGSSFEVVCAFNIIEHIRDDVGFIKEISRICKHNGIIFLSTSAFKFLWSEHDVANEHKRRYTKQIINRLLSADFVIKKNTYTNFLLFQFILIIIFFKKIFSYQNKAISRSLYPFPGVINLLLIGVLMIEKSFLKYMNFPFGVSLFCVAQKNGY